jgi:hypothetical protein
MLIDVRDFLSELKSKPQDQEKLNYIIQYLNFTEERIIEFYARLTDVSISKQSRKNLLGRLMTFWEKPKNLDQIFSEIINADSEESGLNILKTHINLTENDSRAKTLIHFIIENNENAKALQRLSNLFIDREISENIEAHFTKIYREYMQTTDAEDFILQPTIGAVRDAENKHIYTNIFFYENFLPDENGKSFQKDDFQIHQNLQMDTNLNLQLVYYVCFKKSGNDRKKGNEYRMHKFSIRNKPIFLTPFSENLELFMIDNSTPQGTISLDLSKINEVMAIIININPETSRGTVTTVTQPTNDD